MVALLAAAAGWGTRWLLTAPRFAVERVEVAGQGRLSAEDIIGAWGIAPGQNLFRIDARRGP